MSDAITIEALLLDLFGDVELRRFITHRVPEGAAILQQLPGTTASPAATVQALVEELARRGRVDGSFFEALREERPIRATDIEAARVAWSRARPIHIASRWIRRHQILVALVISALVVTAFAASQWPPTPQAPPPITAAEAIDHRRLVDALDRLAPAHPAIPTVTPPSRETPVPTFFANAVPTTRRTVYAGDLELVTFSLAESKSLLSEDRKLKFDELVDDCVASETWPRRDPVCKAPTQSFRKFSPDYAARQGKVSKSGDRTPFPVFTVVLRNRGRSPALVTQIRYRVHSISEVMFALGEPLEPTARYVHSIHHETGDQLVALEAPFLIEPGGIGDFELEVRPATACLGCGWLMQLFFATDSGEESGVATETFQLWTSKHDTRVISPRSPA